MIRVLIVDDSAIYRKLLRRALAGCDQLEVVGEASNGKEAIERIPALKPDVLTLDMNMPNVDGTETLAVLAARHPGIRSVIVTTETPNDAERAVMVLEAGAADVVVKPRAAVTDPIPYLRRELAPRLVAASGQTSPAHAAPTVLPVRRPVRTPGSSFRADVVAIGSSTGGPAALHAVLRSLPADFPVPIVVVQHMPKLFVESLAGRLQRETKLQCKVAEEGERLAPGSVCFAPGAIHMEVVRQHGDLTVQLQDGSPEHHCKPAADVTLRSLARLAPAVRTLTVVLTGMGADAAAGAKAIADAGGAVIAQDKASSVVWGMPGETVRLGAADQVLGLDAIGAEICRQVRGF